LPPASAKDKWEPIAPEDLAATECKSYPGSSAEVLLEKLVMTSSGAELMDNLIKSSSGPGQATHHYRRIKIYSPQGAKDQGVYHIDYPSEQQVWNLAARLTKPTGATTEFSQKEFAKSLAAKQGSTKMKRLALVIPDVGAGDVLEMKWSRSVEIEVWSWQWWYFQDVIPVRRYVFSLEGTSPNDYRVLAFNRPAAEKQGAQTKGNALEIDDIPPFVEEPLSPPTRDLRGWFVLLSTDPSVRWLTKGDVWNDQSKYWEENFSARIKPNSAIKAQAAKLLAGGTTDEEKLGRLYAFVQEHVSNLDYWDSPELQAAKKKLDKKDDKQSPQETLGQQAGYSRHINDLFASLARAAGYDVRLARSASRHMTFNVRHRDGWLFLPDGIVVVKLGEALRYYSPGDYYVPVGMLDQSNESATSLITDPKKTIFEVNPLSAADKSPARRKGRFTLDAEGNLEGEVEVAMEGHAGIIRKKNWREMRQEEIDEEYRAGITKNLPAAEVSDLQWENLKGNKLPLITRYKLKIPGYADVAGSKLILSPNVFEHGRAPVFVSETRKYPVFFDHTWSEHDDIEVLFPEGYTLEAGSAPANVGDPAGVAGARYQVGFNPKARKLVYKRDFALGANGTIALQAGRYAPLKNLFDAIKRSDEHTMVLKPTPAAPEPPGPTAGQPAS